ncbi:hypothetical protein Ciccas_012860 [Cichlidogyrus casuarinus]|uniref:Ferritin n=1 Tax=Cichlidogyrus casuarinus TaxID=1844966 RepID=A0ABD2PMU9_9PLAT
MIMQKETKREVCELLVLFLGLEQTYAQLGALCHSDRLDLNNFGQYFMQKSLRARLWAEKLQQFLFTCGQWFKFTGMINTLINVPEKDQMMDTVGFEVLLQIALQGEQTIQKQVQQLLNVEDQATVQWIESRISHEESAIIDDLNEHLKQLQQAKCIFAYDSLVMLHYNTNDNRQGYLASHDWALPDQCF